MVVEPVAHQHDQAGLLRQALQQIAPDPLQRIGAAHLIVERDDARPQRVAAAAQPREKTRAIKLAHIAIGSRQRDLERFGDLLGSPRRLGVGDELESRDHLLEAGHELSRDIITSREFGLTSLSIPVTPAKAGVHKADWIPAFAGMTMKRRAYDGWKIALTFVALNTYGSRQLDHAGLVIEFGHGADEAEPVERFAAAGGFSSLSEKFFQKLYSPDTIA